jgi:hypothetical protein
VNTTAKGLKNEKRKKLAGEFSDRHFYLVCLIHVKETRHTRNFDAPFITAWIISSIAVNSS